MQYLIAPISKVHNAFVLLTVPHTYGASAFVLLQHHIALLCLSHYHIFQKLESLQPHSTYKTLYRISLKIIYANEPVYHECQSGCKFCGDTSLNMLQFPPITLHFALKQNTSQKVQCIVFCSFYVSKVKMHRGIPNSAKSPAKFTNN